MFQWNELYISSASSYHFMVRAKISVLKFVQIYKTQYYAIRYDYPDEVRIDRGELVGCWFISKDRWIVYHYAKSYKEYSDLKEML